MRSACTHTQTISPLTNAHPPIHTHHHTLTLTRPHADTHTHTHTRTHTRPPTLLHPSPQTTHTTHSHTCTAPTHSPWQCHSRIHIFMHARTHARTHACAHAHKHTRTHARSRHAHHESCHPLIVPYTTRLHCHSRFTRYTRQRVHKLQKSRPRRLSFKMHTQTVHLRASRCSAHLNVQHVKTHCSFVDI